MCIHMLGRRKPSSLEGGTVWEVGVRNTPIFFLRSAGHGSL